MLTYMYTPSEPDAPPPGASGFDPRWGSSQSMRVALMVASGTTALEHRHVCSKQTAVTLQHGHSSGVQSEVTMHDKLGLGLVDAMASVIATKATASWAILVVQ